MWARISIFHGSSTPITRSRTQRSEEHTSELQSPCNLVCRLLLEKKKNKELIYRSILLTKHTVDLLSDLKHDPVKCVPASHCFDLLRLAHCTNTSNISLAGAPYR